MSTMQQASDTQNEENRRADNQCLILNQCLTRLTPNRFAICMKILSPYLPLIWIRTHDGSEMLSARRMLLFLEWGCAFFRNLCEKFCEELDRLISLLKNR